MKAIRPALALALVALGGAAVGAPPRGGPYPYQVTVQGGGTGQFQAMTRGPPGSVGGRSGPVRYQAVTLVRGVSSDPEFAGWVGVVQRTGAPGKKARLSVQISGPRGQATSLSSCWVADYRATPVRGGRGLTIARLALRCASA